MRHSFSFQYFLVVLSVALIFGAGVVFAQQRTVTPTGVLAATYGLLQEHKLAYQSTFQAWKESPTSEHADVAFTTAQLLIEAYGRVIDEEWDEGSVSTQLFALQTFERRVAELQKIQTNIRFKAISQYINTLEQSLNASIDVALLSEEDVVWVNARNQLSTGIATRSVDPSFRDLSLRSQTSLLHDAYIQTGILTPKVNDALHEIFGAVREVHRTLVNAPSLGQIFARVTPPEQVLRLPEAQQVRDVQWYMNRIEQVVRGMDVPVIQADEYQHAVWKQLADVVEVQRLALNDALRQYRLRGQLTQELTESFNRVTRRLSDTLLGIDRESAIGKAVQLLEQSDDAVTRLTLPGMVYVSPERIQETTKQKVEGLSRAVFEKEKQIYNQYIDAIEAFMNRNQQRREGAHSFSSAELLSPCLYISDIVACRARIRNLEFEEWQRYKTDPSLQYTPYDLIPLSDFNQRVSSYFSGDALPISLLLLSDDFPESTDFIGRFQDAMSRQSIEVQNMNIDQIIDFLRNENGSLEALRDEISEINHEAIAAYLDWNKSQSIPDGGDRYIPSGPWTVPR